jgi:protein TonB
MQQATKLGHVLAVSGTLVVHASLAAWAMQPEPPIAIPQQQVIQVAMISAPTPREEVQPVAETPPPVLPKMVGMKKIQPPKEMEAKKSPEPKPEKPKQMAMLAPASGPQSQEAEAKNAAITQPVFDASYLRNPPPAYPPAARRRNVEGKVLLKVDVSQEGNAAHVEIALSSGSGLLDEAALKAVERWRFIPARRGSEKIAADVTVPIIFKIEGN